MATRTEQTTKATLVVDITADTTKNVILNNINPDVNNVVFGQVMASVAGLQSHTLNTLRRENKATLIDD